MKLSSVSPYVAWRNADSGTCPLSLGLATVPLQYFGSTQIGRLGFLFAPRKRMSGAALSTIVYGVPLAYRSTVATVHPPNTAPARLGRSFNHGSEYASAAVKRWRTSKRE